MPPHSTYSTHNELGGSGEMHSFWPGRLAILNALGTETVPEFAGEDARATLAQSAGCNFANDSQRQKSAVLTSARHSVQSNWSEFGHKCLLSQHLALVQTVLVKQCENAVSNFEPKNI